VFDRVTVVESPLCKDEIAIVCLVEADHHLLTSWQGRDTPAQKTATFDLRIVGPEGKPHPDVRAARESHSSPEL